MGEVGRVPMGEMGWVPMDEMGEVGKGLVGPWCCDKFRASSVEGKGVFGTVQYSTLLSIVRTVALYKYL